MNGLHKLRSCHETTAPRAARLGVSDKSPDDRVQDPTLVSGTIAWKHQIVVSSLNSGFRGRPFSSYPSTPPCPRYFTLSPCALRTRERPAPPHCTPHPTLVLAALRQDTWKPRLGESSRLDPASASASASCSPGENAANEHCKRLSPQPHSLLRRASIPAAICAVSRQLRSRHTIWQGTEY